MATFRCASLGTSDSFSRCSVDVHGTQVSAPLDQDLYRAVEVAFARLEPLEQRVLGLIYFGRQTQEQVAARLLVSREAVGRVVIRAMKRLAQSLESDYAT
jgi:RNA polymerase sigma factor (sigma-70 family)